MLIPPAFSLLFRALAVACAIAGASAAAQPQAGYGVLVMAHGGTPEWNGDVLRAVEPLRAQYPLEVAFGMADPATMQEAVQRLEARGVHRIGVVRLFVSRESFLDRTQRILGLAPGAPSRPSHEGTHGHHAMALWRVQSRAEFVLSTEGLADAPEMSDVIVDRARALSREPRNEEVLVLAHGPGDDAENERWLGALDRRAEAIRDALPFARVSVATLREDWPEKRAIAEAEARAFVEAADTAGRTAIVIPFRVSGFGNYAAVLEGLEYRADQRGLIPHEAVTRWIARQAQALRSADSVGL